MLLVLHDMREHPRRPRDPPRPGHPPRDVPAPELRKVFDFFFLVVPLGGEVQVCNKGSQVTLERFPEVRDHFPESFRLIFSGAGTYRGG